MSLLFFPFKSRTDAPDDRLSLLVFCQLCNTAQSSTFLQQLHCSSLSGWVFSKIEERFRIFFLFSLNTCLALSCQKSKDWGGGGTAWDLTRWEHQNTNLLQMKIGKRSCIYKTILSRKKTFTILMAFRWATVLWTRQKTMWLWVCYSSLYCSKHFQWKFCVVSRVLRRTV